MKWIAAFFCLSIALFAEDQSEKYYLTPGSLFMSERGLFIDVEGEFYPVMAVKTDEQGVYVDDWELKWDCAECKKPNLTWFTFCAWCGKPRPPKN